jgi:hypothetical protein
MAWQGWVLVVMLALSALANVTSVGQPRKPMEPSVAAAIVLINGALIYLVTEIA